MKPSRWNRALLMVACLIALVIGAVVTWLLQEVEYLRIDSPDGRYTAIVTYRRIESFRPSFPGHSGDKAGFVRIEDKSGRNYGKIGVPMVEMSHELEWSAGGAALKLVGEWDFAKREYRFWNESQTEEIVEHAG